MKRNNSNDDNDVSNVNLFILLYTFSSNTNTNCLSKYSQSGCLKDVFVCTNLDICKCFFSTVNKAKCINIAKKNSTL